MLTDLQANEQRKKKLSMQSMVDLLIAQALSTTRSREAVYSKVVAGMRLHHADFPEQLASKGAYSQCFKQLGEEPIRQLFVHCAAPRACPETTPEAFWKGMRLMAPSTVWPIPRATGRPFATAVIIRSGAVPIPWCAAC